MMRKLLLLAVVLLAALPASASIAFVGASATCGTAASGTSVTVTYTSAGSHQILISVGLKPTTTTVSSVVDSGGSSYPAVLAFGNNASAYRSEIWGTTNSIASTTFTVNTSGTITQGVACVSEYSGGGSFSATNSGSGASGTSWSLAVTTAGNNSWVIASIVVNAAEASFTGSSGTTVRANNTTTFTNAIADQSCGAAGSCTNSGTYPTSHTNEVAAVELQVAAGTVPPGPNKRQKLEMLDQGLAMYIDELNIFLFQECNPSNAACMQGITLCFDDGVCKDVMLSNKPVTVPLWTQVGTTRTTASIGTIGPHPPPTPLVIDEVLQ